ncbi:MAG: protein BatD [Bacteroidales bacterium]|nr:protein BatD [Bacteroidales bacterium]
MKKFLAIILSFLAVTAVWADVTVKSSIRNGNTVEVGERFQVEFEVNAACDRFDCDIQESGLRHISGPFSSTYMSRTITNGQSSVSNTTTYTFILMAEKEGTFTIPAGKAVVEGKTYSSNPLTVKAIPADPSKRQQQQQQHQGRSQGGSRSSSAIGKDDILLGVDLSKTSVYEGEAVYATLYLYFRNQAVSNVADVKLPDMAGFTAIDIEIPKNAQAELVQYKGGNYRAYPIKRWLLYPQHSGEIQIKPCSLTAIVQVYKGRQSFWDDPFSLYQNVQVPVSSPDRKVTVKTLPKNKPASFMNAVGNFNIKGEVTSNQLKANDAVIYRLTIEGTGNLKYVRDPKPDFPADFEVYDPKTDFHSSETQNGISGKRVIEYTIIPRFGGSFTIPPVEFSFFNTKSEKYETVRTEAIKLEVEKSANEGTPSGTNVDYSGTTQERIKVLGSDIRYLHTLSESSLKRDEEPLYGTLLYWLWFILPAVAFVVLLYVRRRELKLRADVVGRRTRKANKVASRRLKQASLSLRDHQESLFYESVHKAMLGYVADKLSIPLSELNGDTIREQLEKRKVDESIIQRCADVLSTCEFARYAPSADDQAMDKLYEEASDTIDSLEKAL